MNKVIISLAIGVFVIIAIGAFLFSYTGSGNVFFIMGIIGAIALIIAVFFWLSKGHAEKNIRDKAR